MKLAAGTILAFDHSLGGGATSYLEGKRRESAGSRKCICHSQI
ncbi:hypothetical protein [Suipraeoptans intestinalis]|nr:hypothetical protein [Suipraeoptans intestinalis]